jgi:hypothetical protein
MASTHAKTIVVGSERVEGTEVKRESRWLRFFKVTSWETISTKTLGSDIHITTDRPIKRIYLNGELINK